MVCVVGRMRDLILQLSKSSIYSTKPLTARVVDYVGEWHSHPQGFSAKASNEDDNLIKKLHQKMRVEGLPAVMLIVAENDINIVVR